MHTSFAARAAAVLTTAGLALAAAGMPATAAERDAVLTAFAIDSNVITTRATTQFFGTVTTTTPSSPIVAASTVVTINGRLKGSVPLVLGTGNGGVDLPRGWGAGQVRVGPTTFTYRDGTSSTSERIDYFNARRDVRVTRKDNVALTVKRTGDRVRFRVRSLKVIKPVTGRYVSLGSVRLQTLTGGRWKDVKRIELDARGHGSLTLTRPSKRRYRLVSDRSATRVGFVSARTGRI